MLSTLHILLSPTSSCTLHHHTQAQGFSGTRFLSLNIRGISVFTPTALPQQDHFSPTLMLTGHVYQSWCSANLSRGVTYQAALATCHRTWWQRKCMSYSLLANSVPWNSRLSSLPPLSLLSPPAQKAGLIWAQDAEEDFNEMNSDSLLHAVIPQILRNPRKLLFPVVGRFSFEIFGSVCYLDWIEAARMGVRADKRLQTPKSMSSTLFLRKTLT